MSQDLSLFFSNMGTRAYATLTRGPYCRQEIEEKAIDDKIKKATTELDKPENERNLETVKKHLQEAVVLTDALYRSKFRNIKYLKICEVYALISGSKEIISKEIIKIAKKMKNTQRIIPECDLELPGFFDAFKSRKDLRYGPTTALYANMVLFTQYIKNKKFEMAHKIAQSIKDNFIEEYSLPFYLELSRNLAQNPSEENLNTIKTINQKIRDSKIKIPLCDSELTALKNAFPFLARALERDTTYQTAINLYEFSTALQSKKKHQATNIALKFSPSLRDSLLQEVCVQHAKDGNDVSALSEIFGKIKDPNILQEIYQTVLSTYVEKGYSQEKIQELNDLVKKKAAGCSKLILLQDLLKKGDIEKARQLAETLPDTKVDYNYRTYRSPAQRTDLPEQYFSVDANGNHTPIYTYKELASLLIDLDKIAKGKEIDIYKQYSPEAKPFAVRELYKAAITHSKIETFKYIARQLTGLEKSEAYALAVRSIKESEFSSEVFTLLGKRGNNIALDLCIYLIQNKEMDLAEKLFKADLLKEEEAPKYLEELAIQLGKDGKMNEARNTMKNLPQLTQNEILLSINTYLANQVPTA